MFIVKMAEDAGLKISSSHVNPPDRVFSQSKKESIADFWKNAVEDHSKLGVSTLVQPIMPTIETRDDVKLVCEVFNKAGEISNAVGIK